LGEGQAADHLDALWAKPERTGSGEEKYFCFSPIIAKNQNIIPS
jgi:hypothetical protein